MPPDVTGFALPSAGALSNWSLSSLPCSAVYTPPDVMGFVPPCLGVSSAFHMLPPFTAFSAEMIASLTSSPRDAASIIAICLEMSDIKDHPVSFFLCLLSMFPCFHIPLL